MTFRDDRQLARACRALLAHVGLAHLWTSLGPTHEAATLLWANGASLAPRDRAIFLAAWAFWNGSGGITLAELLDRLDVVSAEALCFLVMASKYDADAVDDWLVVHGRPVVAA